MKIQKPVNLVWQTVNSACPLQHAVLAKLDFSMKNSKTKMNARPVLRIVTNVMML